MAAKTQNPVPPVFPMGVSEAVVSYGSATVFPLGEVGMVPYPPGSLVVSGATWVNSPNGVYTPTLVGGQRVYVGVTDGAFSIRRQVETYNGWVIYYGGQVVYADYGSAGDLTPPSPGDWSIVAPADGEMPTVAYL